MSTPFPSTLLSKIRRMTLTLNENKAIFESILTRKRQVVTLSGGTADRWEGVVETVILFPDDVRTMWTFLNQVGIYGDFTIKDPDYGYPKSSVFSGVLVNGASQSGTSLACDGAPVSRTILYAGEYFQIGTEFKVVTADAVSNGSGQVTFNFKPALRASPADNAPVITLNPQMLLTLMTMPSKNTDEDGKTPFSIAFQESI